MAKCKLSLVTLEGREVPAAATPDPATILATTPAAVTSSTGDSFANARFVDRLFRDLARRPADDADAARLTQALDAGASRESVVRGFLDGRDYARGEVRLDFQRYLHRLPHTAGLDHWSGRLQAGMPLEQLRAAIIGSAEYYRVRAGGDDAAFVTNLFRDVVYRDPTAAESARYLGQLQAGTTRTALARTLIQTREAVAAEATLWYRRYLFRMPDSATLNAIANTAEQTGQDAKARLVRLLAGAEYYRRAD